MEDEKMLKEAEAEKEENQSLPEDGDEPKVPAVAEKKTLGDKIADWFNEQDELTIRVRESKIALRKDKKNPELKQQLKDAKKEKRKHTAKPVAIGAGLTLAAGGAIGYAIIKGNKETDAPVADATFEEVPNGTPEE